MIRRYESFSCDLNGNLAQDGAFDYVWDGDNRLIRATTRMDRGTPGVYDNDDRKVECVYDYMSRRVRKTTYTWSGGWVEDADGDQLFVYDRWNVVLVLNANAGNDTLRKYTWGLDLSGWMGAPGVAGIHGAGGIGGLLAAEETATAGAPKYWFFCDGNGNVTQILDPNDFWPEPTAHYEYDPYGNLIRAVDIDGSGYVNDNPFRFSTKWWDGETAMLYYGYRYLIPKIGRWGSRDPLDYQIETAEGEIDSRLNTYRYVNNQPNLLVDPFGLQAAPPVAIDPVVPPGPGVLEEMWCVARHVGSKFYRCCAYGVRVGGGAVAASVTVLCFPTECGRDDIIHFPPPPPPRPPCPPCSPVNFRLDIVPPSGSHKPCPSDHLHIYINNGQGPPPECKCSWKEYLLCMPFHFDIKGG